MTPAEIMAASADSATGEPEPLRTDARRNRERILAVAREALCDDDASLNSIAKNAGVGPGTLYRHFPSREALVLAVYREDIQALTDAPAELLAEHQPVQALRLWFDRLAAYGMTNRSLAGALRSATSDRLLNDHGCITAAAAQLVSACQQDGSIGSDIRADDVLLLLGLLWRIEWGPDATAHAARLLHLIMTALQAGAPRKPSRSANRSALRSLRRRSRLWLVHPDRSSG